MKISQEEVSEECTKQRIFYYLPTLSSFIIGWGFY